ncbi:MAG: hypothetical protein KL863_09045 [Rhizobium sp.]|nr:hypothetical protein [Rhizobium sp.]
MTGQQPLIEDLRACETDEARAEWLRRCPDSVYLDSGDAIHAVMLNAKFGAALPYYWARLAAVHAVRRPDGRLPIAVLHNLSAAAMYLERCR